MTVKWSRTHKRDRQLGQHKSWCGLGYDWPSSISLTDNDDEVDCDACKRRQEWAKEDVSEHEEGSREAPSWQPSKM